MKHATTRRQFLKETAALAATGVAVRSAAGADAAESAGQMPMITLGNLKVSRVFLGSNPFFGYSHGNPQATDQQMRQWYTPQRIMGVLDEAAELGINAVWTPCYEEWIRVWNEYREKGGKLQAWIAQPDRRPMEKEIAIAVENGAAAVCIQGCNIDDEVGKGRWDVVRGWLELIKSHGLPAGMATHGANTHLEAEAKDMPADFYHQTMYRPDNYVKEGLEESLATIEKLAKPVVGYKVLGAGRIDPAETLPYVLKRLKRKDGICVGVFPKNNPHQIRQNAALTRQCTAATVG
ncbi:MAG: twin-arginine translocation signal domain-containing protein [Pirellulales bacterium]|nr:twin-arginine translocation signal domain-containing protein [Pirellulales bacterium]